MCEVQKAKDVKVSVPFHSTTVETCVELISCWPVVCQFVPFVVLSQETQAFWPQLHQVGVKVPHHVCQGGCGSIC